MGESIKDYLIEEHRKNFIPLFDQVKEVCLDLGCLGCSISGSGPSVFALTRGVEIAKEIDASISKLYKKSGLDFSTYVSKISSRGVRVLS
jgi:homoserine kinase